MASVLSMPAFTPGSPHPPGQELNSSLPHPDPATHSENGSSSIADFEHVPRGRVTATLNFFKPPADGSKPHNWVEKPPEGEPQRNFGDFDHEVQIQDLRGREHEFALDSHAFLALKGYPHNSQIDWDDDDSIKTHYYPEVERILLDNTSGDVAGKRVLIFDHTVRKANPNAHRAPVTRAHIDQTEKSLRQRVEFHLPEDEAKEALKGRCRIINVWRPLNGPVVSFPLAYAAADSVKDDDMVPVEHRYPTRTGETAAIRYNPEHQWYYWSGMNNDERVLLQCADSADLSTRVPHSAFVDPRSEQGAKPRESIEVRALIFG